MVEVDGTGDVIVNEGYLVPFVYLCGYSSIPDLQPNAQSYGLVNKDSKCHCLAVGEENASRL